MYFNEFFICSSPEPSNSPVESPDAQWVDAAINETEEISNNAANVDGSDASDNSGPLASRTPSSICPASPMHQDVLIDNFDRLDDVDGLPVIHCDVQMRVQQIII